MGIPKSGQNYQINKFILYQNPRSCTEDKRPPILAVCYQYVELPNQKMQNVPKSTNNTK
jgi:hypothetical protein